MKKAPTIGSSPLTRGKQPRYQLFHVRPRLIPAHAGKTLGRRQPPVTYSAHPRSRGENLSDGHELACARGSSPLTRGKQRPRNARHEDARLIPAHAGKTSARVTRAFLPGAHLRSRGENVSFRFRREPLSRLIPAHAGKTPVFTIALLYRRAHPRSRGENHTGLATPIPTTGSSPLTRGKQ